MAKFIEVKLPVASMIRSYFALPLVLVVLAACTTNSEPIRSKRTAKLDSLGHAMIAQGEILGFSIAIDSAGTSIYSGSFGYTDAEKVVPVSAETRFDIASVSKLVGVSVIMKLVEEGQIHLDQTVWELLPEFPEVEQARKIKLRHLLSHTSGLLDYALEIDSIFMRTGVVPGKQDFLKFFKDKKLTFEPGSNYQYCNSGFMMMAFIAENATNKSWQELIDQYINEPGDLDFQLIKHAVELPETTPIFDFVEGGKFKKIPTWVYVIGDGGLTATSAELVKFPAYWKEFLHPNSFEEMVTPTSLSINSTTGYGLGVRNGYFLGEPIIGHTGGWKSTYAILSHFPELNLTFAGIMNTDGTPAGLDHIFASFALMLLNWNVPDYEEKNLKITDPTVFVGNYHGYSYEFDLEGEVVSIRLSANEKLSYCLGDQCETLIYMGENKFWLESYPFDFIEFDVSKDGKTTALKEYYYGFFQVHRAKVSE